MPVNQSVDGRVETRPPAALESDRAAGADASRLLGKREVEGCVSSICELDFD